MTKAILGLWALSLLWVALRRPRLLAAAAVFSCVFEAAALFSAGGIGLSPYYFALLLIGGRCLLVPLERGRLLGPTPGARSAVGWAVAFAAFAAAGALVLPRVFAGVGVLSPRLSSDSAAPLAFSTSNIGQVAYLSLNVALLWFAAQTAGRDGAANLCRAFVAAGWAVAGFAFYQLAAAVAGLPFPAEVLYSNDAYVMQAGASVLGMPRICATFTEPSSMGVFLTGLVAFLTAGEGPGSRPRWLLLIGSIAALLLSTSSTGLVGLAGVGMLRVGTHLVLPVLRGRGKPKVMFATLVAIAAVLIAFAASPDLQALAQKMVFDKGESASFAERSSADDYSMVLVRRTIGLGVGLGSNRASSFVPSLLSTVGVAGALLLAATVYQLTRPLGGDAAARQRHAALASALLALLAVKALSSPDLATPAMWAVMACLVANRAAAESAVPSAFGGAA